MTVMKNITSYAEIALWDTAIALMSSEKTHRVYSHTVAALTLRLQPFHPHTASLRCTSQLSLRAHHWFRLAVISVFSLIFGILIGWLKTI